MIFHIFLYINFQLIYIFYFVIANIGLGAQQCQLVDDSLVRQLYNAPTIVERHRHRYEFNDAYTAEFEAAGMMCTGVNPDNNLVEVVEVPSLDWYVGVEYHPEYTSTVLHPNPIIMDFLKAVVARKG